MTWWKQEAAGPDWWKVARSTETYDPTLHVEVIRLPSENNDPLAPYVLESKCTIPGTRVGELQSPITFATSRFVAMGLRDLHAALCDRSLATNEQKATRVLAPQDVPHIAAVLREAAEDLDAWKTLWSAVQLGASFGGLVDLAALLRKERERAQGVVRG